VLRITLPRGNFHRLKNPEKSMSPLIKKEVRLLLPAWAVAMMLAVVPAWIGGTVWNLNDSVNRAEAGFWLEGLVPMLFALGILSLGLSPFGQEFSQGTFTVLLSQPVDRARIWRTKLSLLFFAFLTVWLAGIVSIGCQYYLYGHFHPVDYLYKNDYVYFNKTFQGYTVALSRAIVFLTLSVLVVFSGGLWTTLLLRQITNAFWFTLLTPLAIIFGIMSLFSDRIASDKSVSIIIIVALAVYSIAGFFAAIFLFRRCQDLQGSGGEVSFSWFKKSASLETAAHAHTIPFRPRSWFSALCWKEIQLHQVNILIAGLLLLLHLSSFVVRKIHPHFSNPDLQAVLEMIWLLWLLMPILIGCSTIAEERRFGIMESQLSLPVSRRQQLFIKFSIGLLLSLLLGAAIPLLVEGTKDLNHWLFLIVAGLFFVSFYASSFARTVLQAMGLAIIVGVVLFFGETITVINVFGSLVQHGYFGFSEYQLGLNFFKVFLGLPILLVVLIRLIFWNYKQLRQNTSLLQVNFFSLVAAFAAIYLLSYGIYFRAWEFVTPTLPLRGFMRLSPAPEVKLAGSPGAIYAVLPDGRLSIQTRTYGLFPNGYVVAAHRQSVLVPGTNWVETAADNFQAVGLRSDGSLWSITRPWVASHNWVEPKGPFTLAQIGSETNWSHVANGHLGFLLLKNDGSLWTWGTNGLDWGHYQSSLPAKLASDLTMLPTRLGDTTNWIRLCSSDVSAYAMNDHYDVWNWLPWIGTNIASPQFLREYSANGDWATITVNHNGRPVPITTELVGASSPNAPWSNFTPDWSDPYIRITTNGELWVMPHFPMTARGGEWGSGRFFPMSREKWKSATFCGWNRLIAIRSDGTLWKWPPFANAPVEFLRELRPVQLGSHSDWIALSPNGLSLASDGSLWAWGQPGVYWLAPSRKPTYMGNIFEATPASP
jgi:ABC-type transport system involved in multi-copper enzyme maturation permease subunit